jgi:hypothetical protein
MATAGRCNRDLLQADALSRFVTGCGGIWGVLSVTLRRLSWYTGATSPASPQSPRMLLQCAVISNPHRPTPARAVLVAPLDLAAAYDHTQTIPAKSATGCPRLCRRLGFRQFRQPALLHRTVIPASATTCTSAPKFTWYVLCSPPPHSWTTRESIAASTASHRRADTHSRQNGHRPQLRFLSDATSTVHSVRGRPLSSAEHPSSRISCRPSTGSGTPAISATPASACKAVP